FAAIGNELGQYIGRKRAEDALRESDRRKDEFLAVLAHELRNPLAPVRNAFEILKLGPRAPEAAWASQVIDRQITHLTRLVDDLLPADVPRIFDFFTQGVGPGRSRGGLGVGLGLVRQLVELHGGTVAGSSAGEGRGSEFTI